MRSFKHLSIRAALRELIIILGAPVLSVLIALLAFDPDPGQLINVAVISFSAASVGRMIIVVKRLSR